MSEDGVLTIVEIWWMSEDGDFNSSLGQCLRSVEIHGLTRLSNVVKKY